MQAQIVQIGNSLGLRLPKAVLESLNLERSSKLDIQTRSGSIVLRPLKEPRDGWAAAFIKAPASEPENLWCDMPIAESWDE
jgi:antitoxin MazE